MIRIEEEKLIIEISHPCPGDFSRDLKEAIIGTMQYQDIRIVDPNKLHDINCTLLELLKNL
jgi:hypothetical protein